MIPDRPRQPISLDARSSVWHPRSGPWLRARRKRSFWLWIFDVLRGRP